MKKTAIEWQRIPPPYVIDSEELYVELGNGSTPKTSQFMDVIRNLQ